MPAGRQTKSHVREIENRPDRVLPQNRANTSVRAFLHNLLRAVYGETGAHAVHKEVADTTDGLIFVKTHNALLMDRRYPTISFEGTAGAVHVMRNPLDVAISSTHHVGTSIDNDPCSQRVLQTREVKDEAANPAKHHLCREPLVSCFFE